MFERKKLKLRSPLEVGEEVLVLASRLKKKDSPGKFYNFHKSGTFLITNRQKIEGKSCYWLKSSRSEKNEV